MEQIFKNIVEHSFEGVIIIDADYRIKYMNRFAAQLTGFTSEESQGKFCYEVLRAKLCKDACPIRALKKGDNIGEIIVDIITKDNKQKFIKTRVFNFAGHWVEIFHDVTREVALEKRIGEKYIFEDIITGSKYLIDILREFPKIAAGTVPVLFEGESGVGKEVFANALQALSQRKTQPFVKINCASLPANLLESELFGYKKGAFTDARKDKPGLFITAHKGTLFLDEIGEMGLSLQAKLLRAVETGEIIPLGATKTEKIDVRILAATNKNLAEEVRKGNFREDLFYRLNVVNIRIPPLRERKMDVPLFIDYFINQFNIIQKKKVEGVTSGAMDILMNHDYHGNIRELRNIMEYIFIFCNQGLVKVEHLPEYLKRTVTKNDQGKNYQHLQSPSHFHGEPGTLGEKQEILAALERSRWNKSEAARELHVDRSTLWRKMKKYNIT